MIITKISHMIKIKSREITKITIKKKTSKGDNKI
jgi:hypothetical protein